MIGEDLLPDQAQRFAVQADVQPRYVWYMGELRHFRFIKAVEHTGDK